jgi:hypothetical protein
MSARVYIDGAVGDGMIGQACPCRDPSHTHLIDRVTVSSTTAHRMLFSVVNYDGGSAKNASLHFPLNEDTDKPNPNNSHGSDKDLGQIVLTIHKTRLFGPIPFRNREDGKYGKLKEDQGHVLGGEQKKLVPHKIRYAEYSDFQYLNLM